MSHEQLVKQFIKDRLRHKQWFKQITPFLKAIVISPSSHPEILLYMPRLALQQYTVGSYDYLEDGVTIHVLARSIEKVREIAHSPSSSQVQFYHTCNIIWEQDEEFRRLIARMA